jgi:hypothetical protein
MSTTVCIGMNYKPAEHIPLLYPTLVLAFEKNEIQENEIQNVLDGLTPGKQRIYVNARDNAIGNTLLHIAAKKASYDFMNYLLSIGAIPQLANIDGQTPLDIINTIIRKTQSTHNDNYYNCLALLTTHIEKTKQVSLCYGCWPF